MTAQTQKRHSAKAPRHQTAVSTIETKEHGVLPWPGANGEASSQLDPVATRAALTAEWMRINPKTPDDIAMFYAISAEMGPDLESWHQQADRQEMTRMLVHVATQAIAQRPPESDDKTFSVVDIGCGAGHDLLAIRTAVPDAVSLALLGVEPNRELANAVWVKQSIATTSRVEYAPLESADLLICIDVLEHLPDPEAFLGDIAHRAPIGCLMFEATATFDHGTPLHLPSNRGWRPGRVMEKHGWELVDRSGAEDRVRVWRRFREVGVARSSLLLCAYRSVTIDSLQSIMGLTAGNQVGWRLRVKAGDALISRSRSILVTQWWRDTNDDVFLMVDDDVTFSPNDADRICELCRSGLDIVCGAYPVHNGEHFACRTMPGLLKATFGPGQPPLEIVYAATGFMAVHRKVIDAMIAKGLPLCNATQPWSFYPLFNPMVVESESQGGYEWLSEDWAFSEEARRLGFRVWMDMQTVLAHTGNVSISPRNMSAMHAAIKGK